MFDFSSLNPLFNEPESSRQSKLSKLISTFSSVIKFSSCSVSGSRNSAANNKLSSRIPAVMSNLEAAKATAHWAWCLEEVKGPCKWNWSDSMVGTKFW